MKIIIIFFSLFFFGMMVNVNNVKAQVTSPCFEECFDNCPEFFGVPDLGCVTACELLKLDCWVLFAYYTGFFQFVQIGNEYSGLSPEIRRAIAPYIELALRDTENPLTLDEVHTQLAQVNIGTSGRVVPGNAMTDCNKISYPSDEFRREDILSLRGTRQDSQDIIGSITSVSLLYHEIVHTLQCEEEGGPTGYSFVWFSQLSPATINILSAGNYDEIDMDAIHDAMLLEVDADNRGGNPVTIDEGLMFFQMPVIVPSVASHKFYN